MITERKIHWKASSQRQKESAYLEPRKLIFSGVIVRKINEKKKECIFRINHMSGSKMSLKKVKSTHHQNLFFDFSGRQFHNNNKKKFGGFRSNK